MNLSVYVSKLKKPRFSFLVLIVFGLLFAGVGTYLVFQSLAGDGTNTCPVPNEHAAPRAQVAACYGLTEAELNKHLADDDTLKIKNNRLLYFEKKISELEVPTVGADLSTVYSSSTIPPNDQAFNLHSKSGAKRVLYLDFDGHTISNTGWNNGNPAEIVAPSWDIDGDGSSFSDVERSRIVEAWMRVAEDYSAFDVDVTTKDPGDAAIKRDTQADENYGNRVLVSKISSYFGPYGGLSYVGTYDDLAASDQSGRISLVFPEALADNAKYIAEAASHENGHSLGLFHDGLLAEGTTSGVGQAYYTGYGMGATGWAPIMGSSYARSLSQWSKGEYSYATEKQDDLVVIQSNGLSYRSDDVGNDLVSAHYIGSIAGKKIDGVIEKSTDVDARKFDHTGGALNITVSPALKGGNLDILTEIRDTNNQVIASSNPIDLLSGAANLDLAAGTYYLLVSGTGKADPAIGYTNYSSIGQYTIVALGTSVGTADINKPNVSISSPVPGSVVKGVAAVTATATDNVAISKVEFAVDNAAAGTTMTKSTDGTYSLNGGWNTTTLVDGEHTLTVTATDTSNLTNNYSIKVLISNNASAPDTSVPVVTIANVADGQTVGASIVISASATDNVKIAKMQIYVDGALKASSITGSISYNWKSVKRGSHTIRVTALDSSNNLSEKLVTVSR